MSQDAKELSIPKSAGQVNFKWQKFELFPVFFFFDKFTQFFVVLMTYLSDALVI